MADSPARPPLSIPTAISLVTVLFFTWGFLVSLNDVLVAAFRAIFHLPYRLSTTVQVVFYLTCLLTSFLGSRILTRTGWRVTMMVGLGTMALATLCFAGASQLNSFGIFLASLCVMAAGITILQTAASPYVSLLGDPTTAPSRFSLALAVNSLGSMLAPSFGAWLILPRITASSGAQMFRTPYLAIGTGLALLVLILSAVRLPPITQQPTHNTATTYRALLDHPRFLYGLFAIVFYVGAEIAIGGLLINFLGLPTTLAASRERAGVLASFYGGGAMVGRFIGFPLLRRLKPLHVLSTLSIGAFLLVILAMLAHGPLAAAALLGVGLCNSVMVPIIVTTSLDGLGPLVDKGSGLLVAALIGGAIAPFLQGTLADAIGLRYSFIVPALCYIPSAFYALFARSRFCTLRATPALLP